LAKESKSKSKKLYIGKYSVGKILVGLLLVGVFAFFSISVVNQNADISRLEKQKAEIGAKYDAQLSRAILRSLTAVQLIQTRFP